MIPAGDQWRPFAPDLDPAERRARLRSLRAIARPLAGPRAEAMNTFLRQAETDPAALEPAADELDRLAPRLTQDPEHLRKSYPWPSSP